MPCKNDNNDPIIREIIDQFDSLQKITDELRLANYSNETGTLICDPAFIKLEELAKADGPDNESIAPVMNGYSEEARAEEIEADIYDSGDYANLLIIPSMGSYVVVSNNEHLATLVKSCDKPDCWEQVDGTLDEELVEKVGLEISNYMDSI